MSNSGSVTIVKGQPREFLREALGNGLLNGEALKAADAVMAENAALRRENSILKGRLAESRKVIKSYREDHLAALQYQYDAEEGWRYSAGYRWQMILAAVGLTISAMCLLYAFVIR